MFKKLIFFGLALLLALSSIQFFLFLGVGAQETPAPDLVIRANEGGDKVTQDELRATNNPNAVLNSVWDGTGVSLFGARNEVVSFNLVIEAPHF